LCSSGGFGGIVDLSKVHVSMKGLPPYVIACGETQERFTWISPPSFTPTILRIYNEDSQLPKVSEGARASVIGKVTKEKDFILTFGGKTVCNVPVDVVTEGIRYKREKRAVKREFTEPELPEPRDFGKAALEVLRQPNIASKAPIFRHYDTEVQGLTVIRPGEADAGVQAPIPGKFAGMAAALDHNPRYSHIDPYLGAANAVAESMRNVAAVGAVPYAMTDCLNMGNPEVPESFNDFVETVKGLSDAARALWLKGHKETPVPFISGNVSFYNESASGKQIDPSPVVCCIGVLDDYRKAITMELKNSENIIFLAGDRKDELGGSAYYAIRHEYGANVPNLDFAEQRNMIYAVIDCIGSGLLESCHDISDGGMLAAVAEMILAKQGDEKVGAEIDIGDLGYENKSGNPDLRADKLLFSETPGFIFEVKMGNAGKVKDIFKSHSIDIDELGKTTGNGSLVIRQNDKPILDLAFRQMDEAWSNGLLEALR
ncbi:phosphoribosylformylglycinamidine synthase, partial [Candidatus Woesearchaeota archaeon]|nr:phosphoribosylformylglycinamidine synthase [Candidatus Woesearchaeota archaeon]